MALTGKTLARRVQAAVDAAGMPHKTLAARIGIDPSALSKALAGRRNFKPLEIALISEETGVPVEDLLRDEEGERTVSGAASIAARAQPDAGPVVGAALARVELILDLDQLLTDVGLPAGTPFRGFKDPDILRGTPYDQGEQFAQYLRNCMNLGGEALPPEVGPLATEIEVKLDVDVAIEPMRAGLDGLAIARGNYRLMMISSSIPAPRQRYTIAHELGHLIAGDGAEIVDKDINFGKTPEETRANAFAAAFLMPAATLKLFVSARPQLDEVVVAELLARYRVSLDALAFRLHNIRAIDADERDRVRRMSSARISLRGGRATDLQARNAHRRPGGLLDRAVRAYAQGLMSIRPIADLLGVHPDTLLVELAPPQFAPPEPDRGSGGGDELLPNF